MKSAAPDGPEHDRKYLWIIGLAAGFISKPIGRRVQNRRYARLVKDEQ